jgi:hypothetical protein
MFVASVYERLWLSARILMHNIRYLRFSDGKEGVNEILEYMKASGADGDEGKEEEPAEIHGILL